MSIRISIVIPMYNAARTIIATIDSCLKQVYPPHELIVVDDCSTDDSVKRVEDHFGNKVSVIRQPLNAGPAAARNTGWNAATGDFVAFLDSDDQWHPAKLDLCSKTLGHYPQIDLLWHYYQTDILPEYSGVPVKPHKTPFSSLLWQNPISTSCVIFRRNLGLRFDEKMRYCEDYDLALRCTYHHATWVLPLYLTRLDRPVLSAGGLSANRWRMRLGEMQSYSHLRRLNPAFIGLIPFLYLWSTAKYLTRKFRA